ncbi:MAG: PEPxxWA-CTERM sorting domain-containing protein [Pseudomonadota bacterium]
MKFIAVMAGALALASAANAATYDAFDSFDGTQGAGGFTYHILPGPAGGSAEFLTAPGASGCVVTSAYCLQAGSGLPGVYKSLTGGAEGTYVIPDDRLLVHPGNPNPIAVFFHATTAGDYDFTVSLDILDRSPTGVGIIGVRNIGGVVSSSLLTVLGSGNPSFTSSGSFTLAAGDVFGIVVSPLGSYSNDSTGLDFTVTQVAGVPEPATWAMMLLGFGAAGAMVRQGRRARRLCQPS